MSVFTSFNKTVVVLAALFVLVTSCNPQTIYIVRHAEKMEAGGAMITSDVPLTPAGEQRAQHLKDLLLNKGVKYIFSTPTMRTRSTAGPLSDLTGVPVQLYAPRDTMNLFVQRVRSLRNGNVLIVGHSNTVDDLVNSFTGKILLTDLPETEYDNLFILHRKGNIYRLERKKF